MIASKYVFNYDYWYQDFLKYFSKEQIHMIIFEELIKWEHRELNRIFKFIGIDGEENDVRLPKINEGNFVMQNMDGFKVAKRKTELQWMLNHYEGIKKDHISREKLKREFWDICEKYDQESRLENLDADKKEQKKLEQHFYQSVRNLEKMLNRNLHEIWF